MVQADLLRQVKPELAGGKLPPEKRAALRAVRDGTATAQQQQMAWNIWMHDISGINQIALAMPGEESTANWRNGLRFGALYAASQAELPAEDGPEPEPPPRTITERVNRRKRSTTEG